MGRLGVACWAGWSSALKNPGGRLDSREFGGADCRLASEEEVMALQDSSAATHAGGGLRTIYDKEEEGLVCRLIQYISSNAVAAAKPPPARNVADGSA